MNYFRKSEQYRKYLIKLVFEQMDAYTVWGTDMLDDENDKLLVIEKKLIVFSDLRGIKNGIVNITSPFKDGTNFIEWTKEEDLSIPYSVNDFRIFHKSISETLKNKEKALGLLNCLNLIQDFSIQTNFEAVNDLFNNEKIILVKEFIYNNFFWKNDEKEQDLKLNIEAELVKIYDLFLNYIEVF